MLSIIIPGNNEMPQAAFTLHHLAEELKGTDYEILFVDNRSSETTTSVCDSSTISLDTNYSTSLSPISQYDCYAKPWSWKVKQRSALTKESYFDDRIRCLRYDNKLSHWAAKNYAIAHASGDILLFLDAHTIVGRDSIKHMLQFLQDPPTDTVGTVHMQIKYMFDPTPLEYAIVPDRFCYTFTPAQNRSLPYEVPVMSTCGMMCRRDILAKLRAWNSDLGIYGGGEAYINFKLATCGYTHWIHPKAYCWHYAADRGYSWNLPDWLRNNMIAAYTVGGRVWLDKLCAIFKAEGKESALLRDIQNSVLNSCLEDRQFIQQHQRMSYDAYVCKWTNMESKSC